MILGIDTATVHCGLALISDDKVLFESIDPRQASEKIIEVLNGLVEKAEISLSDLQGVVVIKGPGSFTGIRVGISVANTLAHELKVPIKGVSSDEWYFHQSKKSDFLFLQSMNRDEVYIAGYGKFSQLPEIRSVDEISKFPVTDWVGQLKSDHESTLNHLTSMKDKRSTEETWSNLVSELSFSPKEPYSMVEAYYGKAPNISKAKKL